MEKTFIQWLTMMLCIVTTCCADNSNNPAISLNPQDVPIFYDTSPLTGMKSFVVITSLPLKDSGKQTKVENAIEKTLKTAGEVIRLKDSDMRGFGAGNILLIQMGNMTEWSGNETSLSRLSLSVETSVTVEKTAIKTFPMVFSINTFLQKSINSNSEDTLTKALQKLIGDFIQNYQYANQGQTNKPIFYIYN